jgi:aspartate/tyrosine/aromatic aminotransferase
MFTGHTPAPPDAILGLTEAFKADPRPGKVNLGVGVYMDDQGRTPVLASVKEAERRLLEKETTKSYLPIEGSPAYARGVQGLLFGTDCAAVAEGRVKTAQAPGGTGALRVGADFIRKLRPGARVSISDPTWANHRGIFAAAGLPVSDYPYYRDSLRGVDFPALRAALEQKSADDVVVLHVCCHNPTGADLAAGQWKELAGIAADRGWTPFFDFAYQGFGESLEADRAPLLDFLAAGVPFFVSSSFSKNFGLYNERVGALTLVAGSAADADASFSHVKTVVRVNYSNPSAHGGAVAAEILGDPALRAKWVDELDGMRRRIRALRSGLVHGLRERGVTQDFSFIERQRGMFSFSGLNDEQVAWLRERKGIYVVKGGRMNVAGIRADNLDVVCDALAEMLR